MEDDKLKEYCLLFLCELLQLKLAFIDLCKSEIDGKKTLE